MNVDVPISLIVACDIKGGIAKDGKIPWHYPQELKYFSKITSTTQDPTKKNAIIMGRKTWDSLPRKPLPNRVNIIITRDISRKEKHSDNVVWSQSMEEAIEYVKSNSQIENTYVIGGESVYSYVINNHYSQIHIPKDSGNHRQVLQFAVHASQRKEGRYPCGNMRGYHIHRLYYTEIHDDFQCDQFFPIELFENQPQFTKSSMETGFPEFSYHVYEHIKPT